MDAKECIKGRRSIRKFTEAPIPCEVISEIVETASYSPSWKHTQITRYVAVTGELKERIAKECTSIYAGNAPIIDSAAVLMVITYVKNRSGFERDGSFSTSKEDRWEMFDTGISTQSLCLAAYDKGIGSVILGLFDYDEVAKILELPEGIGVAALVPMGYPAEEPNAPRRKAVEELLSFKN